MFMFHPRERTGESWLAVGLFASCIVMGCGVDTYQERLNRTRDYYNVLDHIEANLAPKWSDGRIVDFIRVPRQFQAIPAPVPVKNEDGKEEMPPVDPRQPDFLNLVFPASTLAAAWEAPFDVPLSDGAIESRKAYIYVLSNYWMFIGEEGTDALKFTGTMIQLIGDALEEHLPQDKLENPEVELHPKPGGYFASASYSTFRFKPKPITLRESTVPYSFTVYARQNGNVQCLVLVALPENISSKEKLTERIPMMLEHFSFTRNEPRPGQSQTGPTQSSAPAGF